MHRFQTSQWHAPKLFFEMFYADAATTKQEYVSREHCKAIRCVSKLIKNLRLTLFPYILGV